MNYLVTKEAYNVLNARLPEIYESAYKIIEVNNG